MTYPFPAFTIPVVYTPAILSATAQAFNGSNISTHTFTSQAIGTASSDRLVIVVVGSTSSSGGGSRTVTSATIGGVSATVHTQGGQQLTGSNIISAIVPTGTTATISITFSGLANGCGIQVYSSRPASATPYWTGMAGNGDGSAVASRSLSVTTKAGGFTIMAVSGGLGTTGSSGGPDAITQDWNKFDTGWLGWWGAYSAKTTSDGSALWTITPSSSSYLFLCAASWL